MWEIGQIIEDRYEIKEIREGGMGIVYICYDILEGINLAIKTFKFREFPWESSEEFLERFEGIQNKFINESKAWISLGTHENIVTAYYVLNMDNGGWILPHIFLEYIDGNTLRDLMIIENLSGWWTLKRKEYWKFSLYLALGICRGLEYAYANLGEGFVHRDIKPENILITKEGIPKVTDFGLAKVFDELPDITSKKIETERGTRFLFSKSGSICGTPPYMSPEQCLGKKDLDVRSDVYSFGCVLYEMLTRRYIFNVLTAEEFIYNHINCIPINPRTFNQDIPEELDYLIMRCLEKDPEKRPKNFFELDGELLNIGAKYKLQGFPESLILSAIFRFDKPESFRQKDITAKLRTLGRLEEKNKILAEKYKKIVTDELIRKSNSLMQLYFNTEEDKKEFLEEAIKCLEEAKSFDPKNVEVRFRLADIYCSWWLPTSYGERDKFYNLAIQELEEIIKIDPAPTIISIRDFIPDPLYRELPYSYYTLPFAAYLFLGNLYMIKEKYDLALSTFRKLLEIIPQKKYKEFFESFKEEYNEHLSRAHYGIGLVYRRQKEIEKAIEEYKKALEFDPKNENLYLDLALVYYEKGELNLAIEKYENFLKIKYDVEKERGKIEIDTYNTLYDWELKGENSPNIFTAYVMERENEYQKSRNLYKKYVEINVEPKSNKEALEKIFAIKKLNEIEGKIRNLPVILAFCLDGPMKGHKFIIKGTDEIFIGRDTEMNICLSEDPFVSRKHAKISFENDKYFIEDLGSTNGTYLNKTRVENKTQITDGNIITIGHTDLQLRINPDND